MFNPWELCISIQQRTVKMAVCKANKKRGKIEVSKAVQIDIPEEHCSDRDQASAEAITGLIKKALRSSGITLKNYRLCISDRDIITRVVKLPKMNVKDLESFMRLSIQQYFPINAGDYCFDYKIQSINPGDDKAFYNLLLVAMPKIMIEYYSGIFLKCGLKPKVINIYPDVVSKLFLVVSGKDTAIVDIGYNYTEFIMLEGRSIFINSIINYALPQKDEDVSEESHLANLDEDALGEDFMATAETIKNYLNFFSSRHHGKSIEEVYFIGEGALLKDAIYSLQESLNIKILTGQELINSKITAASMSPMARKQFNPERFFSCLGLIAGGMVK